MKSNTTPILKRSHLIFRFGHGAEKTRGGCHRGVTRHNNYYVPYSQPRSRRTLALRRPSNILSGPVPPQPNAPDPLLLYFTLLYYTWYYRCPDERKKHKHSSTRPYPTEPDRPEVLHSNKTSKIGPDGNTTRKKYLQQEGRVWGRAWAGAREAKGDWVRELRGILPLVNEPTPATKEIPLHSKGQTKHRKGRSQQVQH